MPVNIEYAKKIDEVLMKISTFFKQTTVKTAALAEIEKKTNWNFHKN